MKNQTLAERQKEYERVVDFRLMGRTPIIVRINGKNFDRFTRFLPKPCPEFAKIMAESMLYCISELQGAVFGFCAGDEVTFVLTNFQNEGTEAWFDNRIQKINSISASLFTHAFIKNQQSLDIELNLVGDPIFDARVFAVPSITEAVNNLIFRQSIPYRTALYNSCFEELSKKMSTEKINELMFNSTTEDQKDFLLKYCGINFEDFYPAYYYKGIGLYRVPSIINKGNENITKHKWELNWELPFFITSHEFLQNIILSGKDIIRRNS